MIIPLEDRILSLFHSGIYLTNKELVSIGEEIGISLPLKSREILLGKVINFAKEQKKFRELMTLLDEIVSLRLNELEKIQSVYPASKDLINEHTLRIEEIQLTLKEELQ